jgi:ketosteroid isomerase-like protein
MPGTLQDRSEIRELTSAYAAAASRKDARAIGRFFTEDACVSGVGEGTAAAKDLVGSGAISDFFERMFGLVESVTHMPHTADIVVSGDAATASCDIVEYVKFAETPGFIIVVGHYDDNFRRTIDGWRFAKRVLSLRIWTRVPEAPGSGALDGLPGSKAPSK